MHSTQLMVRIMTVIQSSCLDVCSGKCILFEFVTEKIKMIEVFPNIHSFSVYPTHCYGQQIGHHSKKYSEKLAEKNLMKAIKHKVAISSSGNLRAMNCWKNWRIYQGSTKV